MAVIHNGVSYKAADAHTHIYPEKIAEKATANVGNFYGLEMHDIGLPKVLYTVGTEAGIERFLVCSVATKPEQVDSINRFISEACKKYPAFVGLGAWHQDITDVESELDKIQTLGLHGIKLHPDFQRFNIDDEKMMPVYEACHRRGLPILFHMGDERMDFSAPFRLAKVLEKIPDLLCIAAHLGGYQRWEEALQVLHGGNLYVDTSSTLFVTGPEKARRYIEHFGVDKTMFGTDFPMWTHADELNSFFEMGYSEEDNRKMLWDNFAKLFSLE